MALSIIIAWSANLNAHETSFTPCLPCLTSLQIAARRNKRTKLSCDPSPCAVAKQSPHPRSGNGCSVGFERSIRAGLELKASGDEGHTFAVATLIQLRKM
ncbi:hypothetical protein RBB77_09715 [Tunturibacter psychrotolerans]|uniref:Secreted protein n=1 Tax=Tunturiibacter psychrotolerans TaxID=3069686 RepID=A0AAU7ZW17_9BACT